MSTNASVLHPLTANRPAQRLVGTGKITSTEAARILRAARLEVTRELGPIRSWPPNMSAASILAHHDADAEAIDRATRRVVGRMYDERRRKRELVRYHRSRLEELLA